MHWQAYQFVLEVKSLFPHFFIDSSVLEIGSHVVNDSIRELFHTDTYVGVDLSAGNGVDVIASGHEFKSSQKFDIAISCECFEHNPYYMETLKNMIDHTQDDGLIVFSCATAGRPEHGTSKTDPSLSPGTSSLNWDYYKNLTESDFNEIDSLLKHHLFITNTASHDLYFLGTKSEAIASQLSAYQKEIEKRIKLFEQVTSNFQKIESELPTLVKRPLCPLLLFAIRHQAVNKQIIQNRYYQSAIFEAFEQWPDSPNIEYLISEIYNTENQPHKALVFSRRAYKQNPNPFFTNSYVECLRKSGKYEKAFETLKSIPELHESHPLLWKAADLCLKLASYNEADDYIDKALEMDFHNAVYLNTKRIILEHSNRVDEATTVANQILELSECPEWIRTDCEKWFESQRYYSE